jgi:hypothetical protein
MTRMLVSVLAIAVAACGQASEQPGKQIDTSGKSAVEIAQVPAEVMAAAQAARPGFTAKEAERETREGRRYFDIEGVLTDGSEIEFDIMESEGRWQVVETQRDIAFDGAPLPVRDAVRAQEARFVPDRVIESTQNDGVIIYELYGPKDGDPQGRKVEVKWDGREARILTEEWAH